MHLIVGIAWLMWKSNAWKYMCIINGNAVRGHSSENYLTQRFYRLKDFCTRNVYSTCKLCIYLLTIFCCVFFRMQPTSIPRPCVTVSMRKSSHSSANSTSWVSSSPALTVSLSPITPPQLTRDQQTLPPPLRGLGVRGPPGGILVRLRWFLGHFRRICCWLYFSDYRSCIKRYMMEGLKEVLLPSEERERERE